jgi:dihydroorotase
MQLTLLRPDDWHLHVRDGKVLDSVIPPTAERFGRAIIMPNLRPPVTTVAQALTYREHILAAVPEGRDFTPLMTLYLTDNMQPDEIDRAVDSGHIHAVKLYPAGATTNSDSGVTNIRNAYPVLEAMQRHGMPFLVHGEVVDPKVDVFDLEAVFIERVLEPLRRDLPELKVVFEHITTAQAVDYVLEGGDRIAATITPQHLLYNRNAILVGGIHPHFYCLPVLKRETHRQALLHAATGSNPRFFLGTDSAPHQKGHKESACGCAGMYSAHAAIELYAEAFEQADALDKLEAFASINGARFYGLPVNDDRITLIKESWQVPDELPLGDHAVVPMRAGEQIGWKLAGNP